MPLPSQLQVWRGHQQCKGAAPGRAPRPAAAAGGGALGRPPLTLVGCCSSSFSSAGILPAFCA